MELFCRNRGTCLWDHSLRTLLITGVLGFWIQQASGQDGMTAQVGQKIIMQIPVTGEIVNYTWYRGPTVNNYKIILIFRTSAGVNPIYGPGYTGQKFGLPDGSLQMTNVQLTDTGNYTRCIAVMGAKPQIATEQLRVYELLPKPTVKISVSQPIENQSVALTCDNSNSATTILWFFNNSRLQPENNRITLSSDNKTLTFSRISRSNGGSYRCETQNPVSRSTSDPLTVTVTVSLTGSRLSGGAIAGIVVAVVVVLIAVTGSIWYFKRPASNKTRSYAPPTPTA